MSAPLIRHIEKFIPVSDALQTRLKEISIPKTIEKGKFLHRPKRVCENTYFIASGLLRIFYRKGEKEITDNFAAENEWITSIYSFMKNVPDNCYIETLETSELIGIGIKDLEKCFQDFPEMERFGRILISNYFVEQSERIISLQFHSAKERYQFFRNTSKNKLSRVPLGMLASHLGMTQETLSRVRAQKDVF
ncbi:Crp/Fnr family transcriptional regulator [Flagellimonas sp. DF-77]|uniref:Crp/Fnr family transcriptional regulator n=1 Tax=Flagellimonas algarum TaxID=3230298 RepID=UPI0033932887